MASFCWDLNIWCVDAFDEISVFLEEDLWVPWWVATAMQNGCTMRRTWIALHHCLREEAPDVETILTCFNYMEVS